LGEGEAAALVLATVILLLGSAARRDPTGETVEVYGGAWRKNGQGEEGRKA